MLGSITDLTFMTPYKIERYFRNTLLARTSLDNAKYRLDLAAEEVWFLLDMLDLSSLCNVPQGNPSIFPIQACTRHGKLNCQYRDVSASLNSIGCLETHIDLCESCLLVTCQNP